MSKNAKRKPARAAAFAAAAAAKPAPAAAAPAKPALGAEAEDDFGNLLDAESASAGISAADLEVSDDEDMDTDGPRSVSKAVAASDDEAEAEEEAVLGGSDAEGDGDETQPDSKKRKRAAKEKSKERKKKKFAESLERATLREHTPLAQAESLARHLLDYTINDQKMTSLEVQDKLIPESCFLDLGDIDTANDDLYPDVIRAAIPNIEDYFPDPETGRPKSSKMSLRKQGPLVLILCSSGIRCMDVIRKLRPLTGGDYEAGSSGPSFRGGRGGARGGRGGGRGGFNDSRKPRDPNGAMKLRVGKLFAKHMKLEEQVQYLDGYAVHVAVGTPNRIAKLLEAGALKTGNLRSIILDVTYRDAKQRTLFTAAESRVEFFQLYLEHLANLCKGVKPADVAAPAAAPTPAAKDADGEDDAATSTSVTVRIADDEDEAEADGAKAATETADPDAPTMSKKKAKKEARRKAQAAKAAAAAAAAAVPASPPLMCIF
ncbi:cms1 ribosomal small subunit [Blastocladiella emersonii ATCC 22665]|nr:cms1 ribosomal small subunit [Blastocladiella emersonii ATCC 22665]